VKEEITVSQIKARQKTILGERKKVPQVQRVGGGGRTRQQSSSAAERGEKRVLRLFNKSGAGEIVRKGET